MASFWGGDNIVYVKCKVFPLEGKGNYFRKKA